MLWSSVASVLLATSLGGESLFYFHLDNLCDSFIILLLVVSILFFKFQSFCLNVVRCQDH